MIIDTSALVAILKQEDGYLELRDAIGSEGGLLPAPAEVEFAMVAAGAGKTAKAKELMQAYRESGLSTMEFSVVHAKIACEAFEPFGKGNGKGGPLNLLDLMVYAVAKERDEAILCTGKDFAATDARIHQASRAR